MRSPVETARGLVEKTKRAIGQSLENALRGYTPEEAEIVRGILQNPNNVSTEAAGWYMGAKLDSLQPQIFPKPSPFFFLPDIDAEEKKQALEKEQQRLASLPPKELYEETVNFARQKANEWRLN